MKKLFTMLAFVLIISIASYGQNKYKALKVGDTVPDMVFEMLNGSNIKMQLADYKGKLLIIDCWSIYCVPCIKALPEFAELQDKFKGSLNILALEGGSPKDRVLDFLSMKEAKGQKIALPVAYIDPKNSDFYDLFPILKNGFPVEIWIDENGILIGITPGMIVNDNVISKVLNKDFSGLIEKHSQSNFKSEVPLLLNDNGGPDSIFSYRSLITPYIGSLPQTVANGVFKTEKHMRLFFPNLTKAELVKMAIYKGSPTDHYNKQLYLTVKDSASFMRPLKGPDFYKQLSARAYCYELILPPNRTTNDAFDFMKHDIDRYFNISASIVDQQVKCLFLESINAEVLKSAGGKSSYSKNVDGDFDEFEFKNIELKVLLSILDRKNYPLIIDNTKINYLIDFTIKLPHNYNFETLNKSLNEIGLKVTEKIVSRGVLRISDF